MKSRKTERDGNFAVSFSALKPLNYPFTLLKTIQLIFGTLKKSNNYKIKGFYLLFYKFSMQKMSIENKAFLLFLLVLQNKHENIKKL